MDDLLPSHGGTDSGPPPLHDFSTNANPLGPCPSVLAAIRGADLSTYPDPRYARLRETLGAHHGVAPHRIVVGAGASELILRLVRAHRGPVHALGPTFSEYGRCARVEGRAWTEERTPADFLAAHAGGDRLGFVCWPNNPTGDCWLWDFLTSAATAGPLAVDLAYAPFCDRDTVARVEAASANAIRLYAPNKAFGLCGVRAAYLVLPSPRPDLENLAPCWVLDRCAETFLAATVTAEVHAWLEATKPLIASWRATLAHDLRTLGLEVRESPAPFLLVRVSHATQVTAALRHQGLRVRDATSFGLPDHLRLSVQALIPNKVLACSLSSGPRDYYHIRTDSLRLGARPESPDRTGLPPFPKAP